MKADERRLNGAESILVERQRQIEQEGFDAQHDDDHVGYGLSRAAACYAVHLTGTVVSLPGDRIRDAWPWAEAWDKRDKHDRRRRLIIAGALIAAEIDRLDRLDDRRSSASVSNPQQDTP